MSNLESTEFLKESESKPIISEPGTDKNTFISQANVKVSLRSEKLENALRGYTMHTIRNLAIVGNITAEDFNFLRDNLITHLDVLDLSEAYFPSEAIGNYCTPKHRDCPIPLKEIYFPKNQYLKEISGWAFCAPVLQKIHNLAVEHVCETAFHNTAINEATIYARKVEPMAFPDGAVITNIQPDAERPFTVDGKGRKIKSEYKFILR